MELCSRAPIGFRRTHYSLCIYERTVPKCFLADLVLLKFTITPIAFSVAQGHGAKGDNVYEFHLEFFDLVKPEVCSFLSLEGGPQDLGQVTQIPPVPPSQGLRNPAPTA